MKIYYSLLHGTIIDNAVFYFQMQRQLLMSLRQYLSRSFVNFIYREILWCVWNGGGGELTLSLIFKLAANKLKWKRSTMLMLIKISTFVIVSNLYNMCPTSQMTPLCICSCLNHNKLHTTMLIANPRQRLRPKRCLGDFIFELSKCV